ncbi:hypothetical protein D3C76_1377960 [compost metagenome]
MKTEVTTTKEESIFAIAQEINEEQKVKEILPLIAHIDWHAYNEISGGRSMELIEFLSKNSNYIGVTDYPYLILATNGLDGAWSESFAAIVGGRFMVDRDEFINALAESEDLDQRRRVISLIAYNLSYQDVKPIIQELQELSGSAQVHASEKEVIHTLITELENPY